MMIKSNIYFNKNGLYRNAPTVNSLHLTFTNVIVNCHVEWWMNDCFEGICLKIPPAHDEILMYDV